MKIKLLLLVVISLVLACQSSFQPKYEKPTTRKKVETDIYHGVAVKDSYRWLENQKSEEVRTWTIEQTKSARRYLDQLPSLNHFKARLSKIMRSKDVSYWGLQEKQKIVLSMKEQPPLKQPILVKLSSAFSTKGEEVLVDPNQIDKKGSTNIEWFVASPSGKYVAVCLAQGGAEIGNVHVYEVATGKKLNDIVKRVEGPTAGGSLVWLNEKEFLYTRYPRRGERPDKDLLSYQKVYRHKLGAEKDHFELGKNFDRITATKLKKAPDSDVILATSQYGDSGKFDYYLRLENGRWKKIIHQKDQVVQATLGYQGNLFMISRKDAPKGKLLKMNIKKPLVSRAQEIVAERKDSITSSFYYGNYLVADKDSVFMVYQLGGPSEIRVFDYEGRPKKAPIAAPVSSIGSLSLGKKGLYFSQGSYTSSTFYHLFNAETGKTQKTAIGAYSSVDLKNKAIIVREVATSKDGTLVPVNIIYPTKYKRGEKRPLILSGYGGFGISRSPRFRKSLIAWLEKGGIYAEANIRGGGEFGKKWHDEGRLTKKQNVFDDFFAVAKHLVDRGYTSNEKLGIIGGSNGGLLMGAMLTQYPNFFKAVASYVGIYDSLRYELSSNGAFNIPEYGTVKNKKQFEALYTYSPYHNFKDKMKLPATLLVTGANDGRVDPMHSRKMAARMQEVQTGEAPILLEIDWDTGHGSGTPLDKRISQKADQYAFFYELLR